MSNDINDNLADQFLGWQCRIRQHAVRKQEGRPPPGICPSASVGGQQVGQLVTMICKQNPANVTAEFEFLVKKNDDPRKRYESALEYLAEYYYQFPREFDRRLTALFALDNELGKRLVEYGNCQLCFVQGNQRYDLECRAFELDRDSLLYQATYWHNHLFNPNMPGVVRVAGFEVDWSASGFSQLAVD